LLARLPCLRLSIALLFCWSGFICKLLCLSNPLLLDIYGSKWSLRFVHTEEVFKDYLHVRFERLILHLACAFVFNTVIFSFIRRHNKYEIRPLCKWAIMAKFFGQYLAGDFTKKLYIFLTKLFGNYYSIVFYRSLFSYYLCDGHSSEYNSD